MKEYFRDRKIIPAIAVNSMIVGSRDFEEAFELAALAEEKLGISTFVDLRSRRNPSTDNEGLWIGAHENSSFDIINRQCLQRAVSLAGKYHKSIIGTSVYLGAFSQQDYEYGKQVIEGAIKLTPVAPHNTIIVRIVGGSKKVITNAKSKNVVLSNLQKLTEYAYEVEKCYNLQTGLNSKIILGIEIHQGQYPENIEDVVEIYKTLRNVSEEFLIHIGIIEDPANRYISTFGRYQSPALAAQIIHSAGGKILYYHLKDVKFIDKWDEYKNNYFWMEGFQQVGNGTLFEFDNKIFEWRLPCEGDINFQDCVNAALEYSSPPHGIIGFSTEHVPASKNREDAREIIMKYGKIISGICSKKQIIIGVEAK
jgi:sugar phosphate isomerase/epimerase